MGLIRTVAPDDEVISLEEMKSHLREESTEQDVIIQSLTAAAIEHAEIMTARALATQTWQLTLDHFPWDCHPIRIPRPPLQSITSIQYVDQNGVLQTWSSSEYSVDIGTLPGQVSLAFNKIWPTTRWQPNAVTITYVAGYGADVPEGLRAAIRLLTGHLYEHREAVITGTIATELPLGITSLISAYRYLEA